MPWSQNPNQWPLTTDTDGDGTLIRGAVTGFARVITKTWCVVWQTGSVRAITMSDRGNNKEALGAIDALFVRVWILIHIKKLRFEKSMNPLPLKPS